MNLLDLFESNDKPIQQGVKEGTGVTDYNPKTQGGTRKELLAKYHKTKNPKDAEAARKAGATQKELQGVAEGLPAHIKKSDVPPSQRAPLTMRDIEAERPQGAFRYRVINPHGGEGAREFMSQASAEEHARAVGGRVEPIREGEGKATPRIERILKQLRIRYPQAKDDLEALIYSFQDSAKADRRDINRLDQENDQEESDIEAIQAMIDQIRSRREAMAEARKPDYNFDIEDIKRLEQIKDMPTLRAQAMELIARPSQHPMKPEKVAWFKEKLESLVSPMKIIKLMYDLLLSGEGHQVIGTRHSMGDNTYRQRFGETSQDKSKINVPRSGPNEDPVR